MKKEVDTTRIRRLPAGLHGIPREVVERNQRERLIAAMAEMCAEKGYGETSVADVTRQAGVSTASFYRQFADRRECMLASFEELFERLVVQVEEVCEREAEATETVKAAIRVAAELLGEDLPSARLLTVEILAAGEEGVALQHAAIGRLAEGLARSRGTAGSDWSTSDWASIAAMAALVARRVIRGEKPPAAELEKALVS